MAAETAQSRLLLDPKNGKVVPPWPEATNLTFGTILYLVNEGITVPNEHGDLVFEADNGEEVKYEFLEGYGSNGMFRLQRAGLKEFWLEDEGTA